MKIQILTAILSTSIMVGITEAATINPVLPDSTSLKWTTVTDMPEGAEAVILSGNPTKEEPFVAWLKLPAGYTIPVHEHPINEYDTVITGTYYLGSGEKIKLHQTQALPVGSFVKVPAKTWHYGWVKKETIIQISGVGPWGMIYPEKKEKPA